MNYSFVSRGVRRAALLRPQSRQVYSVVRAEPVTPKEPTVSPETPEPVAAAATPSPAPGGKKYELKHAAKPFGVTSGEAGRVASASLGLVLRAGCGILVQGYSPSVVDAEDDKYKPAVVGGKTVGESSAISGFNRPAEPLVMYEFDACPFCKKVREMVSYLDIDCIYKPTPSGGPTYRPEAIEKSGKSMFPYMEDPNTGKAMNESDDIIKYLADTYGDGTVPLQLRLGAATVITAGLSGLPRMGKGGKYRAAKKPAEPIVIWGYEGSPFVRLVRERLTELELPNLFKTVARGSPKRQELYDKHGSFAVPYLEDPNTGVAMFESAEIVKYLEAEYAIADVAAA